MKEGEITWFQYRTYWYHREGGTESSPGHLVIYSPDREERLKKMRNANRTKCHEEIDKLADEAGVL